MDQETNQILRELVEQLREGNRFTRETSEKWESSRDSGKSGSYDMKDHLANIKRESEERVKKYEADAEEERAQRKKFQSELLEEFRRLNENLETYFTRSVTI